MPPGLRRPEDLLEETGLSAPSKFAVDYPRIFSTGGQFPERFAPFGQPGKGNCLTMFRSIAPRLIFGQTSDIFSFCPATLRNLFRLRQPQTDAAQNAAILPVQIRTVRAPFFLASRWVILIRADPVPTGMKL